MRADELEFLIAQYADGTLDSERTPEVEAILRRSESAREMLESYRALERVLSSQNAPEIRWDRLEDRISRQIATAAVGADSTSQISEDVEEQFSRLAEGNLSPAEARLIEVRLSADPQARLVLSEYMSLERLFEAVRARPLPAVRWHKLNDQIAKTLGIREEEAAPVRRTAPRPATTRAAEETGVLARIGAFFAAPRKLAMAACVLVAAAIGVKLASNSSGPGTPVSPAITNSAAPSNGVAVVTPPAVTPKPGVIEVTGPTLAVTPNNDPTATANSVKIGPPANGVQVDPDALNNQTGEAAANRGSSLLIAPDKSPGQDKDAKASRDSIWPFPR
jgi:negative regulator of sigma E activity